MTTITASMVKELRERTSAGMLECKKALEAAGGDLEKAVDELRKRSGAKLDKVAGRVAAEGIVALASDQNHAFLIELNCETDFVSRGDDFVEFANRLAQLGLNHKVASIENFLKLEFDPSTHKTVEEARHELVAKIGENIQIRRLILVKNPGHLGTYLHGTRIGTLVALEGGNLELAKDLAMHVAASRPQAIRPEDVSPELIAREKEIYIAQVLESGKPAEMAEKIVAGKLNKFLSDISLHGQSFVKDPEKTVAQLLAQHKAVVVQFIRFEVGEGIEKQTTDFAKEVMEQVRK